MQPTDRQRRRRKLKHRKSGHHVSRRAREGRLAFRPRDRHRSTRSGKEVHARRWPRSSHESAIVSVRSKESKDLADSTECTGRAQDRSPRPCQADGSDCRDRTLQSKLRVSSVTHRPVLRTLAGAQSTARFLVHRDGLGRELGARMRAIAVGLILRFPARAPVVGSRFELHHRRDLSRDLWFGHVISPLSEGFAPWALEAGYVVSPLKNPFRPESAATSLEDQAGQRRSRRPI